MAQQNVQCSNCGTEWAVESGPQAAVVACPVCHLPLATDDLPAPHLNSIDELEVQLDTLIRSAQTSGLDPDMIAHALREELEFVAEMGHVGRRFSVQLIDLGPQEGEIFQRPARDRRELVRMRTVNG